ncbi:MAG: hypothetical protein H6742_01890 [Alphaproteobacteria bacterium]|nr:hypothetical protein [Alphaproteobacteria bacterium]
MGRKRALWAIPAVLAVAGVFWALRGSGEEDPVAEEDGSSSDTRDPAREAPAHRSAPGEALEAPGSACLCLADADGAPLGGVEVDVPDPDDADTGGPTIERRTDRAGCLPPGTVPAARFDRVRVPGRTLVSSALDLEGTTDAPPGCGTATISLWAPACPSRLCVDSSALGPDVRYEQLAWSPEGGGRLHAVPLDEDQCADIPDLGCGVLGVRLDEPDGRPRLERLQVDGPGEQRLVLSGQDEATVSVRDEDGNPVEEVWLACTGRTVETLGGGRFVVRGPGQLLPCHAGSFDHGARGFPLELDGGDHSVRLKDNDSLTVTVRGVSLPDTAHLALRCEGLPCREPDAPSAAGHTLHCPCPQGNLQLDLVDEGPLGLTDQRLLHAGFGGPEPVTLDLREDGRIAWHWRGPGPCVFDLYGPGGSRHGTCADGDAGSFDGLRRGSWELVLHAAGDDRAEGEGRALLNLLDDPDQAVELRPGDGPTD